ncbi:protein terminal ear1-like [Salvia splendens]|uniref:protein terminal ear1-like n=1 Tax=Salvia splendens TaxID=180675 RepID=UPI001C27254D|nr:protein terminal ear1-like [Salvia splendens]
MIPRTAKTLNPFAPEYNPIPSGVTPSPHAAAPSFLPPLSTPPSPFFLPHQILSYLPTTSHNTRQQFHPSTYRPTPQHQASTTPPPPRNAQLGRGYSRRGRGRVSGRERSGRERRGFARGGERPQCEQFSNRSMHNVDNKHQITPLQRDQDATTIMIRNIPYNCRRKELIGMLDDFCLMENQKSPMPYAYDFLYLPIDFRTRRSRGFAFVNFTSSSAVWKFYDNMHLANWDFLPRSKWKRSIEIVCAKIQGKEELVRHFSKSMFECESDEYLPVCFTPARDGLGQPVELTIVGNRR